MARTSTALYVYSPQLGTMNKIVKLNYFPNRNLSITICTSRILCIQMLIVIVARTIVYEKGKHETLAHHQTLF